MINYNKMKKKFREHFKPAHENLPKETFRILRSELEKIQDTVGSHPSESGGLLLGNRDDFVIRRFVFDENAITSGASYTPDIKFLNRVMNEALETNGYRFLGMVHSHPVNYYQLSGHWGDLGYIERIFNAMPALDHILVPIVQSAADTGEFKIYPYIAYRGDADNYIMAEMEIVEDNSCGNAEDKNHKMNMKSTKRTILSGLEDTSRIESALDLPLMAETTITVVGIGGILGGIEDLVRSGVKKIIAIDFDTVSHSNLTTQGYYLEDVGLPKVVAAERLMKRINPHIDFVGINADFTKLPKERLEWIISHTDFWMFMCDQFEPHALGNKILMNHPKPAVFAGMYDKGQACEVFFYIPEGKGKTPACYRCAMESRYAFFEKGGTKPKTLYGSTIIHSHYLNSVIGMLVCAIINRNTEGFTFSDWFQGEFPHNFVQIRLNPKYSNAKGNLFERTYPNVIGNEQGSFALDALWRHVSIVHPSNGDDHSCPDCCSIIHEFVK